MEPTTSSVEQSDHYDADYYRWQSGIGRFGAWANAYKFRDTIKPDDVVLDFGCGGGFLLEQFACKTRIGIEPNREAAANIRESGITHYLSSTDALAGLGESAVDTIISNHALEHTIEPARELRNLHKLLKPGGTLHFVVPCENISMRYRKNDINHHLFSWSPQNLGNLLTELGFELVYSRAYVHKWPPGYRHIARLGWPVFNVACRITGQLRRTWFQVEAKGIKR